MKTFTVERHIGVNSPLTGRKVYLRPGVEYRVDGRQSAEFFPGKNTVSKDFYDKVVEVEPEEVDFDAEETNEEED